MKCTINQSPRHTRALTKYNCTINFPLLNASSRRHRRNNTPFTAQTEENVAFMFIFWIELRLFVSQKLPIKSFHQIFTGSQRWELLLHVRTSDMTHNPLRGSRYIGCLNLSPSSSSSTFFMAVQQRLHSPDYAITVIRVTQLEMWSAFRLIIQNVIFLAGGHSLFLVITCQFHPNIVNFLHIQHHVHRTASQG